MNYSELLQLAKGWGNFVSDRINIGALTYHLRTESTFLRIACKNEVGIILRFVGIPLRIGGARSPEYSRDRQPGYAAEILIGMYMAEQPVFRLHVTAELGINITAAGKNPYKRYAGTVSPVTGSLINNVPLPSPLPWHLRAYDGSSLWLWIFSPMHGKCHKTVYTGMGHARHWSN